MWRQDGGEIDTALIVTTFANGMIGALHDRMPVILEPDDFDTWLTARSEDASDALRLVRPADDDLLQMEPCDPRVPMSERGVRRSMEGSVPAVVVQPASWTWAPAQGWFPASVRTWPHRKAKPMWPVSRHARGCTKRAQGTQAARKGRRQRAGAPVLGPATPLWRMCREPSWDSHPPVLEIALNSIWQATD